MARNYSISMHKPHVSGNAMGVILTIGVVLLLLLSFLSIYWFILGILLLGAIMCVFLFKWHNQHKLEFNDLSALEHLKDKTRKK
ncbi:MAG: hypothetical protein P8Z37_17145 [Acidobacteriota bacterium]|jgi:hypothetical protein